MKEPASNIGLGLIAMANNNVKCIKCGKGRGDAGNTISAACNRKNSTALSQTAGMTDTVILVNEALVYAQYHIDGASTESIITVMAAFYTRHALKRLSF